MTNTITVLPLRTFKLFRYQVTSTAHQFGKGAAIEALQGDGRLEARALALGLSVYQRGKRNYVGRLQRALKKDGSEEARAILDLVPESRKQRAPKRRRKARG